MKKLLYLSLLSTNFLVQSNVDLVITEPYKVGTYDKITLNYPVLSKFVKSTCVGTAAFLLSKYTNDTINPAYVGITSALAFNYFQNKKKPNITKALLINPLIVSQYHHSIEQQFRNDGLNINIDNLAADIAIPAYRNLIQVHEKKSPIFLLGECVAERFGACVLSRSYQPKFRNAFENEVVAALINKFNSNLPVEYIGFATGGMFQDLVLLTKALALKPDAHMNVHLIDKQFYPYVTYLNFLGTNRDMSIALDQIDTVIKRLVDDARESFRETDDEEIARTIKLMCARFEARYKQMITYISSTFPKARVKFYVHDSTASYLDYVSQHNLQYPDVISAADIQDEMSLLQRSMVDYAKLCVKTMQQKNNTNVLLAKNYIQGIGQIKSFSLSQSPQNDLTEHKDIEIDTEKISIYEKNSDLTGQGWLAQIGNLFTGKH